MESEMKGDIMKALIRKMLLLTLCVFALCSVAQPAKAEDPKTVYRFTYKTAKPGVVYGDGDTLNGLNTDDEETNTTYVDWVIYKYRATADGYVVITNYNANNDYVVIFTDPAEFKKTGEYTPAYYSMDKTMRFPVSKDTLYYIRPDGPYKFKLTPKTATVLEYNISRLLAKPLEAGKKELVCAPEKYAYNRYYSFVPSTTGVAKITVKNLVRGSDDPYVTQHLIGLYEITVMDRNGKKIDTRWAAGDVYKTKVKLKAGQTYYIRVNVTSYIHVQEQGMLMNISWTQ